MDGSNKTDAEEPDKHCCLVFFYPTPFFFLISPAMQTERPQLEIQVCYAISIMLIESLASSRDGGAQWSGGLISLNRTPQFEIFKTSCLVFGPGSFDNTDLTSDL